jgi:hypothetical protein
MLSSRSRSCALIERGTAFPRHASIEDLASFWREPPNRLRDFAFLRLVKWPYSLLTTSRNQGQISGRLALIVLPSLVVGNELLILGGVGVCVGGWFLAHRHGTLRGALEPEKARRPGLQLASTFKAKT